MGRNDRLSRNKVVRDGGRKTSWKICERSVKKCRDKRGNGGTWRTSLEIWRVGRNDLLSRYQEVGNEGRTKEKKIWKIY